MKKLINLFLLISVVFTVNAQTTTTLNGTSTNSISLTVPTDTVPVTGSTNFILSGGVYKALQGLSGGGGSLPSYDFSTLTYGATVNWDQGNSQQPEAKLTATGNFVLNMTNVKSGAQGILKVIAGTASAITISFDTDFTNKSLNQNLTVYTLPAGTGNEYFLQFVVEGTNIEWYISDGPSQSPAFQTWVPTITGFSSIVSYSARYTVVGKICFVHLVVNVSPSNATTFTVTLPFAAANTQFQVCPVQGYDAGVYAPSSYIRTQVGSNIANVYKTTVGGTWTASGNKGLYANFFYETL